MVSHGVKVLRRRATQHKQISDTTSHVDTFFLVQSVPHVLALITGYVPTFLQFIYECLPTRYYPMGRMLWEFAKFLLLKL